MTSDRTTFSFCRACVFCFEACKGTAYCTACAEAIRERRKLRFKIGDFIWCRPVATIQAQKTAGTQKSQPTPKNASHAAGAVAKMEQTIVYVVSRPLLAVFAIVSRIAFAVLLNDMLEGRGSESCNGAGPDESFWFADHARHK
eukprot:4613847-Amphidinium_carterae.1